jgi:phage baseplate assembly protein W
MPILKMPLQIDSSGRLASAKTTDEIVKQKITDYLITSMFERPMIPSYGANTDVLIFENFDSLFFEEFKLEALSGLKKHVSGAQISNMYILGPSSLQDSTVSIAVEYSLPTFGTRQAVIEVIIPSDLNEDSPL